LKLIVESQNNATQFAKQLVNKAREELTDVIIQEKVLEFIETIFVYKFPLFQSGGDRSDAKFRFH